MHAGTSRRRFISIAGAGVAALGCRSSVPPRGRAAAADLIVIGGRIETLDPQRPAADALAIAGSTILAVGSESEIGRLRTSSTRVLDLGGGTAMPAPSRAEPRSRATATPTSPGSPLRRARPGTARAPGVQHPNLPFCEEADVWADPTAGFPRKMGVGCNEDRPWPTRQGMVIAEHFTAHTRGGWDRVVEPASAQWLWTHLREAFPDAFGCTLMPDHVHLEPTDTSDPDRMRRVLQHHARRFGSRWDIVDVQRVTTPRILGRVSRYLVLNAVRDGLVADPFQWPWCTLRDLVGAVGSPWVSLDRLAVATRMRPAALLRDLVGPDCPMPASPERTLAASLDAIAEAAAAACRTSPQDIRRRGPTRSVFLGLGEDLGGCRLADLADACRIDRRSAYDLRSTVSPAAVLAARRCLADERLRRFDVPKRMRRAG